MIARSAAAWLLTMGIIAPVLAGMDDMPLKMAGSMADNAASEEEMGRRLGRFMEGFSQEMGSRSVDRNRSRDRGDTYPPDRNYPLEDRTPSRYDHRSDYDRWEREEDRYAGRRHYVEPDYRNRYRTYDPYLDNPYRYDPWGARYWGWHTLEEPNYGGQALDYGLDRRGPYGDGGWRGYPYGEGHGPLPYAPDAPDYGPYDAYRTDRYRYGTRDYDNHRPFNWSMDYPWDGLWNRGWPFGNRSWSW